MVMKSTETRFYMWSDEGLDFNAGSKNFFMDRFKKILSDGYNPKTVVSVAVSGASITLEYGVAHGYVPLRVLKIESGSLTAINNGEFWINAVTPTSVTLTMDNAPPSIAGGFTTRIAPIGWQLVFEQGFIQVYKFKHLDDTDMYCRLVYQHNAAGRNIINPAVGKSFDPLTGFINDPLGTPINGTLTEVSSGVTWEFTRSARSSDNNQNYTQGSGSFGSAGCVGSKYHFVVSVCPTNVAGVQATNGIIPLCGLDYDVLDYPLIIGHNVGVLPTATNYNEPTATSAGIVGATRVVVVPRGTAMYGSDAIATVGVLPAAIDEFNTTSCAPMMAWDRDNRQFIGQIFAMLEPRFASNNRPSSGRNDSPRVDLEVDYQNNIVLMYSAGMWLAFPLEGVKHGI